MENLSEVKNIKKEPVDFLSKDERRTPTEMPMITSKEESDCLVRSDIYIKTEPQKDETSYETSHNYNAKLETDESVVKIECEVAPDEIMEDPLDVYSEIKAAADVEIKIKAEGHLLTSDDEPASLHNGGSNYEKQSLVKNKIICKEDKHFCDICNKTFIHKGNLNAHLRIHTDEKPFTCFICGKSFSLKTNLDRHMLIHGGEKPYACDVCNKNFNQKSTLNDHKLIHSDIKPFSCSECNKSFRKKNDLVKHQRIHIGNKPFICDFCDKAFTQRITLTRHRRLHTGEKPHSCEICNKSFTQAAGLKHHMRTYKH